jgi:hypothetical protein
MATGGRCRGAGRTVYLTIPNTSCGSYYSHMIPKTSLNAWLNTYKTDKLPLEAELDPASPTYEYERGKLDGMKAVLNDFREFLRSVE